MSNGAPGPYRSRGTGTKETLRLEALGRYGILDTPPEPSFDRITRLAARYYGAPMAFITLVDHERQWFKSRIGIPVAESGRDLSFCARTVDRDEVVVVNDLVADPEFALDPLVQGPPGFRFYAGAPVRTYDGLAVGALGIGDVVARPSPPDLQALVDLAALVSDELELRRAARDCGDAEEMARSHAASLQELAELLDLTHDSVILRDHDGTIRYWNGGAQHTYGWTSSEAVGKVCHRLLRTEFPQPLETIQDTVVTDGHWNGEIVHTARDGRRIVVDSHWYLRRDEGGRPKTLLEINSDVTTRRQAEDAMAAAKEDAERASRAKTDFLASMSHEIRTPMNGILGMSGLLLDTDLSPLQQEYAQTVRESAEALLGVINEILDFSKVEAGKVELEVIDFDLRTTVEDVANLLSERSNAKGLELVLLMHPGMPSAVRGDPGRLRQVLVNLVGNAVKFTDSGEVVIRISMEKDYGDEVGVRVAVTDSGIGIPMDRQAGLFEAFGQADASTTRRFGGTGLGLAISSRLVKLMGGEMGLDSSPGQGSTFWFTIRLARGKEIGSPVTDSHDGLGGLRVLVVDDNTTNRRLLEQTFRQWQMVPAAAASGNQALEMLSAGGTAGLPYDLAVLDSHMPGMNGLELARAIRADPALKDIPLVLLSSSAKRGDAHDAAQAGLQGFLTKPIKLAAMHHALITVMALEGPAVATAPLVTRFTVAETRSRLRARVLVAEDNVVNQKVASRFLEKLGYRADVAADGREAVSAVATGHYDLVLMDCQMPEMDGYEATQAIREAGGRRIPVIAMTAGAMSWERDRCVEAGMDDFLSKPVTLEVLDGMLARWLKEGATGAAAEAGDPAEQALASEAEIPADAEIPAEAEISGDFEVPAEAVVAPDGAVLDDEAVAQIRHIDPDGSLLAELIELFRTYAGEAVSRLRTAVEVGDPSAARDAAHALKGSSGNIGARRMARLCAEVERAAENGLLLEGVVQRVEEEFRTASAALAAAATPPS